MVQDGAAARPLPKRFSFPWPNESRGYELFPTALERDSNVFFHATPATNVEGILAEGFKARPPVPSVTYTRSSATALHHAIERRTRGQAYEVFAVRFPDTAVKGIAHFNSEIYVYDPSLQPELVGICEVPGTYQHL